MKLIGANFLSQALVVSKQLYLKTVYLKTV